MQHRQQLGQPPLVPADRHQLGAGPPGVVGVARGRAAAGADRGQRLGVGEPARPDGQHHVDRAGHEADREVVALGEVVLQLAEQPPGVRVARAVRVGRLPEQAHQQVAAALGAEARLGQLDGQLPARADVLGAEQAVVGDAEGLGEEFGVPGRAHLVQRGQHGGVRAAGVVRLPGQPGADPQGQGRPRVEQREHVLQPRLEQHRAGDGAALGHPQPGQAQRGQRHRLRVAGPFGQPVGALEAVPAGLQVAGLVLGADPVRERGLELVRRDQFQAPRRHRPACLALHRANVFGAARHRRDYGGWQVTAVSVHGRAGRRGCVRIAPLCAGRPAAATR